MESPWYTGRREVELYGRNFISRKLDRVQVYMYVKARSNDIQRRKLLF